MANTLKIKRGAAATIPQGQLAEPLFTTDTYDLYIGKGGALGNQRFQKYIASGTSSQFLKGDGSLDSTTYQATSEKGQNNGYASLDGGGKVPVAQLPNSIMEYKGTWDASTNTPTLADGTGNAGDVYICSVGGTVNFGAGPITFAAGDWVVYSGSVWQKSINSNAVASVNGQTGAVVLYTDDISEDGSPVNLWFTDSRARLALSATSPVQYNNTSGVISILDATASQSGVVTTATQTFAGVKTFSDAITLGESSGDNQTLLNLPANSSLIYREGVGSLYGFNIESGVDNSFYWINSEGGYYQALYFGDSQGSYNIFGISSSNNSGSTWSARFVINQNGDIGIGKNNPSSLLDVNGTLTATTLVKSGGTASQYLMADGSTSTLTNPVTGTGTNNEIAYFNTTGSTIASLSTATYPSLTELSYVKGVTSAIQTQLNAKEPTLTKGNLTETTSSVLTITGGTGAVIGSGTTIQVASAGAAQNGVVTTGTQTFAGAKTFNSSVTASALYVNGMTAGSGAIYHTGSRLTFANYNASGTLNFEVNGGASAMTINADKTIQMDYYTTNGFVKFSSSNGTLTVDTNTYLTTSSAASTYVPYTGATTNVNIGTNSMTAFNFYASSTFYVDSNNYFMKSILELRDNATSTKRLYITADTSESLISTVNTVPLKLRATSGVTEQVVLNTNGTMSFTGAATFSSSVAATSLALNGSIANSGDAATLTIKQSSTTYTNGIYLERGGERNGYYMYIGNSLDSLTFRRNYFGTQSDVMSLTRDGNVGIGTTDPQASLHIIKALGNNVISIGETGNNTRFTIGQEASYTGNYINSTNIDLKIQSYLAGGSGGNIIFQTGASGSGSLTPRMTILSGGNVLIGTTDNSAGYRLNVTNNGASSWLGISNQSGAAGDRYLRMGFGSGATYASIQATRHSVADDVDLALQPGGGNVSIGTNSFDARLTVQPSGSGYAQVINHTNATNQYFISFRYNTTTIGTITGNNTNTAYNTSSDYRLKHDLKDFNGLDIVSKIKSYDFAWKYDDSRMYGVIAHELQEILGYAVVGEKDGKDIQGVDYSKLTPILVKAIQEQQAQIEELKSKLN